VPIEPSSDSADVGSDPTVSAIGTTLEPREPLWSRGSSLGGRWGAPLGACRGLLAGVRFRRRPVDSLARASRANQRGDVRGGIPRVVVLPHADRNPAFRFKSLIGVSVPLTVPRDLLGRRR